MNHTFIFAEEFQQCVELSGVANLFKCLYLFLFIIYK